MQTGTMAWILLSLGALATAGLVATAVVGYQFQGETQIIARHILLGLISLLLLILAHSWIFFYLWGTARAVRSVVNECGLDASLLARSRRFQGATYPWLLAASALATADFVLGAQIYTFDMARSLHPGLFYATVAVQIVTLIVEARILGQNERLMVEIDSLCAA